MESNRLSKWKKISEEACVLMGLYDQDVISSRYHEEAQYSRLSVSMEGGKRTNTIFWFVNNNNNHVENLEDNSFKQCIDCKDLIHRASLPTIQLKCSIHYQNGNQA